jgi:Beta/Gamma crystallin
MSSLKAVDSDPSVRGPLMHHIVLFEHANFHGPHKHVFRDDTLKAPDDNFFDKKVSSLVVFSGFWRFNSGPNFDGVTYPVVRSPGLTPFVRDVGIPNDDMSSLFPSG